MKACGHRLIPLAVGAALVALLLGGCGDDRRESPSGLGGTECTDYTRESERGGTCDPLLSD